LLQQVLLDGRLATIMDAEPEIKTQKKQTFIGAFKRCRIRNVSFTHKNAHQPILKNIDLTIESGKTVAMSDIRNRKVHAREPHSEAL